MCSTSAGVVQPGLVTRAVLRRTCASASERDAQSKNGAKAMYYYKRPPNMLNGSEFMSVYRTNEGVAVNN